MATVLYAEFLCLVSFQVGKLPMMLMLDKLSVPMVRWLLFGQTSKAFRIAESSAFVTVWGPLGLNALLSSLLGPRYIALVAWSFLFKAPSVKIQTLPSMTVNWDSRSFIGLYLALHALDLMFGLLRVDLNNSHSVL